MATIQYSVPGKSNNSPIYIRLTLSRVTQIRRKTGLFINPNDWSKATGLPKQNEATNKAIYSKLRKLEDIILDNLNEDHSKSIAIDGDWLTYQIDLHFKRISETDHSELVTDVIKNIIDTAHIRDNAKGGVGLSLSRIKSYNNLSVLFNAFQGRNSYKIKDLNKNIFESFKKWLFDKKNYSPTYTFKKLSDLKTVCKDARANGIEISKELTDIKTKQLSSYEGDMDVIYLNLEEIEKIEKATLLREAHINARKWLILACFTGQRGNDLIKITSTNFKKTTHKESIEIIQQKTGKKVEIPILPKVRKIYEDGLPYRVSTQKLNGYFKEIGEIAEINNLVMGRIIEASENKEEKKKRGVKKLRPKYKYISTIIGRRSFASNHYGKLPTPIIMKVTGHSKESTFLTYINQSDDSHIDSFLEYYKTQEANESKERKLKIVRNLTK